MKKIDIIKECEKAGSIGIAGHIRPDGDAIGASMGLYLYLLKVFPEKEICVYFDEPPSIFGGISRICDVDSEYKDHAPFDVFFALDSVPDRLSGAEKYFRQAAKTINIDHHESNALGSGMVNYVEPYASSTCELLYILMDKKYMDKDIATALYIGIVHDTGVFHYSCTSPRTMKIGAELMEYGFDFPSIIDKTFYEKTYLQNQLIGRALTESILFMEGKCIACRIDRKTMDFYDAKHDDLDGIVNQLRITRGVECAIFMYELTPGKYKVSLRSNGLVNVAKIAQTFGGGGHERAAGCEINGNFYDALNSISEGIAKQISF